MRTRTASISIRYTINFRLSRQLVRYATTTWATARDRDVRNNASTATISSFLSEFSLRHKSAALALAAENPNMATPFANTYPIDAKLQSVVTPRYAPLPSQIVYTPSIQQQFTVRSNELDAISIFKTSNRSSIFKKKTEQYNFDRCSTYKGWVEIEQLRLEVDPWLKSGNWRS